MLRLLDKQTITLRKIVIFSLKLKNLLSYLKYVCILYTILSPLCGLLAQEVEGRLQSADTLGILNPSVLTDTIPPDDAAQAADSLPPDSVQTGDTASVQPKGDIKTTIQYNAEDSIYFDIVKQTIHLYGNAHIDYGEVSLDAAYIQLDWVNNLLTAQGMADSTGKVAGKPVFKEG